MLIKRFFGALTTKPPADDASVEAPAPAQGVEKVASNAPLPAQPAVPYPGRNATVKELNAWHKALQKHIEKD